MTVLRASAKTLADSNDVELVERERLEILLEEFPVSIQGIHQHEA